MALRAGYKGIKKKYADEINRGEGGPSGGSFSITQIATYPDGAPQNEDIVVEGMSDYDALIVATWQVNDGGYSATKRGYRTVYKAFEAMSQVFDYYGQRGVEVKANFSNNTMQYFSAAPNENAGFKPVIYEIYGIKF